MHQQEKYHPGPPNHSLIRSHHLTHSNNITHTEIHKKIMTYTHIYNKYNMFLNSYYFNQNLRRSYSYTNYYSYWDRLQSGIDCVRWKMRYPGNIYASTSFMVPYPCITEYEVLTFAFIQLLEQYAYNIDSEYLKFTMGYKMHLPTSYDISYTLGKAIPLCDTLGNRVQKKRIYDMIEQQVRLYGEIYQDALIKGVFINIYYESKDSLKSIEKNRNPAGADSVPIEERTPLA